MYRHLCSSRTQSSIRSYVADSSRFTGTTMIEAVIESATRSEEGKLGNQLSFHADCPSDCEVARELRLRCLGGGDVRDTLTSGITMFVPLLDRQMDWWRGGMWLIEMGAGGEAKFSRIPRLVRAQCDSSPSPHRLASGCGQEEAAW